MPTEGYTSLATTGFWADRVARSVKDFNWARPLHYVNIEPQASGYDAKRDCPRGRCVIAAVDRFAEELGAEAASQKDRIQALRWLSHFLADMHQPLHIAHPDNRGGNKTFVLFFGENKKLHWVWDTGLITKIRGKRSSAAYAKQLRKAIRNKERKRWSAGNAESWANEALKLSQRYTYSAEEEQFVDHRTVAELAPIVELQLKRAGIRLALLLERQACAD